MNLTGISDSRSANVPDRVREIVREWIPSDVNGPDRVRTTTWWAWMGSAGTSTVLQQDEASADGTRSWSTTYGNGGSSILHWSGRSALSSGTRYMTNRTAEGAMVISTFVNGRLTTTHRRNSSGMQIGRVIQTNDAHGRPVTVTDDRNGTITHQYVAGSDLVGKVTTPPSGTGDPGQTTVYEYDVAGRAWKVTHPDGGIVNTTYTPRGEVATTYGARSYPVEHT